MFRSNRMGFIWLSGYSVNYFKKLYKDEGLK